MMQYPEFLLIVLLSQRIRALEQEPALECFTDGLRLRFEPEKPFYGHIYVKDSFMYENCHLDYTWNPTVGSFYFNVFVLSSLQREPSGISYQVIIIVQYHYLFLTQAYRAYSVSCFYETVIDPNMQISGLTMTELENEITTNCAYDVLNSINGESVKYANVGDRLIHKWSCESDKYGMLVHSCFVYESDSDTFQLVDNQGCITDHTLMDPLHYSDSLTLAYSVIPAFKFVDKLTIRFQCKVALCIKAQNGCEGISPPKCEYLSTLTSISKHSISKSPSPILSNILQSSLPQNIESLCEENTKFKSCRDVFNANKWNFSTNYRRKRFLNESRLAMNSLLRKSFTETNSTNVTRFTLDIHTDQLVIFELNEIIRTKSAKVPSISYEALKNEIFLQTAIFVLLIGFILFLCKKFVIVNVQPL